MLKLFGWESEMHERIATRREEEVKWLWKRKFYDVIIAIVKCVLNHISRMIFYTGPWQLSDPCFDYARYICISYAHMERRSKWYVNRTSIAPHTKLSESGQGVFEHGCFHPLSSIPFCLFSRAFVIH